MARTLTLAGEDAPDNGAAPTLEQLRTRIAGMQDGVPRVPVPTHPAIADLLQLRTGGAYQVDRPSLGMALLGAASREGAWSAVVGAGDFGVEAAAELGVDLTRTILVPDPGDQWLEATAALVDVVSVVLLRPPAGVTARTAGKIAARLRKRSSVLVVWGEWPGVEARLSVLESSWSGAEEGHGRLRARKVVLGVQHGTAPQRRAELWFPSPDQTMVRIEPASVGRASFVEEVTA
ncbi:hypothetical protein ABIE44_001258 [Marmoricola sp. OAE513]|uniref:hypothetical protein n=1 Tax=Marmoricola sp. OAE513 TaxID=2817894 RepID=UPI001AE65F25